MGAGLGYEGAEVGAVRGGGEVLAGEAIGVIVRQRGKVLTNEAQESWT